ncbi:MAG: alanine racemase [Actinomycetota bacterium]
MIDEAARDFAAQTTDKPTPCLVVDEAAFEFNLATLAERLPGDRCRPHVKAFKSTAMAARVAAAGHSRFTVATLREAAGMIQAGLGHDVLLANETVDVDLLRTVTALDGRLTVAVDSSATIDAAVAGGVEEVLIDVNVGLPRCGCAPEAAGAFAEEARGKGLAVRGVMGYEGHLMMVPDTERRRAKVADSMALLLQAAEAVGGEIVSAGGTGSWDLNDAANEIQAGSYLLMDTHYGSIELPFRQALWVEATVISIAPDRSWIVADAGLKSMGMDHGNPTWLEGEVAFCSDEHATLYPSDPDRWTVGDRVRLAPAHVDPTIAKHPRMWVIGQGDDVTEWPVDLVHW